VRRLQAIFLLLASCAAGADATRLQVSATILSHCRFSPAAAAVEARCSSTGASAPYRIRYGDTTFIAKLPNDVRTRIATPRRGQVLTIEY